MIVKVVLFLPLFDKVKDTFIFGVLINPGIHTPFKLLHFFGDIL